MTTLFHTSSNSVFIVHLNTLCSTVMASNITDKITVENEIKITIELQMLEHLHLCVSLYILFFH
jgi:hypothetical protein